HMFMTRRTPIKKHFNKQRRMHAITISAFGVSKAMSRRMDLPLNRVNLKTVAHQILPIPVIPDSYQAMTQMAPIGIAVTLIHSRLHRRSLKLPADLRRIRIGWMEMIMTGRYVNHC